MDPTLDRMEKTLQSLDYEIRDAENRTYQEVEDYKQKRLQEIQRLKNERQRMQEEVTRLKQIDADVSKPTPPAPPLI